MLKIVSGVNTEYRNFTWYVLFVLLTTVALVLPFSGEKRARGGNGGDAADVVIGSIDVIDLVNRIHATLVTVTVILLGFVFFVVLWSIAWISRDGPGFVRASFIFSITIYIVSGVIVIAIGSVLGVVLVIVGLLWLWVYSTARRSIELSGNLLQGAAAVSRIYKGVYGVAVASMFIAVGWFVLFSFMAMETDRTVDAGLQAASYAAVVLVGLWGYEIWIYVSHFVTSAVVGQWYLAHVPEDVPRNPSLTACRRALSYSFGTIALGSLFITIVRILRSTVQQLTRNDSQFTRFFAMTCLAILETLVRLFNKYVFVHAALFNTSYKQAARSTKEIFTRHGFDVIINDVSAGVVINAVVMFVGLLVFFLAQGIFFVRIDDVLPNEDTGNILAVAMFFAFFVAALCVTIVVVLLGVIESGSAALLVGIAAEPVILRRVNDKLYTAVMESYPHMGEVLNPPDEEEFNAAMKGRPTEQGKGI